MKKILVAVASLFLAATLHAQELPETQIKDVNTGKKIAFNQTFEKGKVTLISFWATWCVPCKKELNNINEVYDDWKKKYDVNVVAVSIDDSRSSTKVKPYAEGQRWSYDVLLDVNQDLKRDLNIQSVPFTVVLDKSGKIVYSHSGYTEGDENILEDAIAGLSK